MVWITKREVAYYVVISQVFRDRPFNIGEALDILTILGSKSVARKIIKKLISRGLLEKIDSATYRVKNFEDFLARTLKEYIVERIARTLKSSGFNIEKMPGSNLLIYTCESQRIDSVLNPLKNIIDIKYVCI
ncbi:MAG: hypothetical protein QW101_04900 [Ignisphaera sp.]|uniref:Transcription regulator TrmB N-terminal domain-containing protein n=1 Tax=Ignisphaera aggregans TaxID=334771 RepID=A0A7J3MYY7_9CREN